MAVEKRLRRFCRIGLDGADVGVRQVEAEHMQLHPHAANHADAFAKIDLSLTRPVSGFTPRRLERIICGSLADYCAAAYTRLRRPKARRGFGCMLSLATSIWSAVRLIAIKAGAGYEQQGFNLVPETVS
jgi:hypothetical protein